MIKYLTLMDLQSHIQEHVDTIHVEKEKSNGMSFHMHLYLFQYYLILPNLLSNQRVCYIWIVSVFNTYSK